MPRSGVSTCFWLSASSYGDNGVWHSLPSDSSFATRRHQIRKAAEVCTAVTIPLAGLRCWIEEDRDFSTAFTAVLLFPPESSFATRSRKLNPLLCEPPISKHTSFLHSIFSRKIGNRQSETQIDRIGNTRFEKQIPNRQHLHRTSPPPPLSRQHIKTTYQPHKTMKS